MRSASPGAGTPRWRSQVRVTKGRDGCGLIDLRRCCVTLQSSCILLKRRCILGPEIILVRGLVKLVPAVAYHFCLNLPATFSQPRTSIISGPSRQSRKDQVVVTNLHRRPKAAKTRDHTIYHSPIVSLIRNILPSVKRLVTSSFSLLL